MGSRGDEVGAGAGFAACGLVVLVSSVTLFFGLLLLSRHFKRLME
ncbi:hypothetical protein [Paracoccus zhejiangensis]|nr:hypothetical protein [Paracoccus zhejiangensis]